MYNNFRRLLNLEATGFILFYKIPTDYIKVIILNPLNTLQAFPDNPLGFTRRWNTSEYISLIRIVFNKYKKSYGTLSYFKHEVLLVHIFSFWTKRDELACWLFEVKHLFDQQMFFETKVFSDSKFFWQKILFEIFSRRSC